MQTASDNKLHYEHTRMLMHRRSLSTNVWKYIHPWAKHGTHSHLNTHQLKSSSWALCSRYFPSYCTWGESSTIIYQKNQEVPVTGASMSSMVFSWRKIEAPSFMIRRATVSSTLPSLVRWAFSRSTLGFPSQSNTSFMVRRWLRGKGTAEGRKNRKNISGLECYSHFWQFFCCTKKHNWMVNFNFSAVE